MAAWPSADDQHLPQHEEPPHALLDKLFLGKRFIIDPLFYLAADTLPQAKVNMEPGAIPHPD